jgi:hypothetical protein
MRSKYKPGNGHRRRFGTCSGMMAYLNKLEKGKYSPWTLPARPRHQMRGKRRLRP